MSKASEASVELCVAVAMRGGIRWKVAKIGRVI